ncbi:MAG: hypothetical protein U5O39_03385 [Gammaproteobacteria bacterium]|nr:hypothetical protein [Gammaproteobacteria bacterium]
MDGVAGRIANDLAAEDNPAMARKIVLDEHHRIRRIYAENLKTLFERPNDAAKGGEGK